MGVQRKRRRREERLEEEEQERGREPAEEAVQEKERPQEREATAVDRVLDLQKTAGNRATTEAISRWGLPWLPMAAAPQWPKEPQMIADGTVIPILSWSLADRTSGAGAGTGAGSPESNSEIIVSTTVGSHSADLLLRSAEGRPFKTVYIVVPGKDGKGMAIELEGVMITSYQTSGSAHGGNVETWSLSYTKREFTTAPPPRH